MARALGRYELLRPLARGGMAEVYLARRRAAGIEKWLVVKRMRPERTGDPRFLDLFVREARLSMSLVHQNIVPVFDFGRIDDQVFLAMERVEGKDLGSSLARAATHRMPPLLAAFIAAECCQALDYAHQRKSPDGVPLGIVHRDVTPRNVLLSWSGEVKLTDFGIAALAGDATSRLLGTPQYMAPEQARGEPIDPRADIYAIGLVLREAISGSRARPGADRDTILDAARRGALLPWSHLDEPDAAAPGLALGSDDQGAEGDRVRDEPPPEALVAIIDRATALNPDDRYPDARSMLEELDTFIVGRRAAQKVESPARQLAAWLATVWDGARDDGSADAAIDAEHLVSFLDDGAHDVLGTGTVRSLAATAADDAQLAPATGDVTPSPVAPPEPPVAEGQAAAGASARPVEAPPRLSRISSSIAKVASGSFHTIPTPIDARDRDRSARVRRPRIARWAGIAVVLTATAAAVVYATWPRVGRPPAEPAGSAPQPAPATVPPTTTQPSVAPPTADGEPHPAPGSGSPTVGQPAPTGRSRPERPKTGPSSPAPPRSGSAVISPPGEGTGSSAAAPGHDPEPARPAMCRVRINLTPWAYYTADDDPTRHETPGTIDLSPGPHRLHVWNPELHVERDITINVPADRDTMNYSEPLQPSTLPRDAGSLR